MSDVYDDPTYIAVYERYGQAAYAAQCAEEFRGSPFAVLKPSLAPDGKRWCALLGDNIREGVVGYGETPSAAANDFDANWYRQRTPEAMRLSAKEPTVQRSRPSRTRR
jgi:hypothetical protein